MKACVLCLWACLSVVYCHAQSNPNAPTLQDSRDKQGNLFLLWRPVDDSTIYLQKMDTAQQPVWGARGLALESGFNQENSSLEADGAGGVVLLWINSQRLPRVIQIQANGKYSINATLERLEVGAKAELVSVSEEESLMLATNFEQGQPTTQRLYQIAAGKVSVMPLLQEKKFAKTNKHRIWELSQTNKKTVQSYCAFVDENGKFTCVHLHRKGKKRYLTSQQLDEQGIARWLTKPSRIDNALLRSLAGNYPSKIVPKGDKIEVEWTAHHKTYIQHLDYKMKELKSERMKE